ncbi:Uncharacterized protein YjlB [Catalinimonas alkaloidigena]|uniref:Uncharacterized protein YjlB n=1 Tax=Catalinimonas alkaloidigena TaxID=1075417 RepID=A0A1G9DJK4_9BACT|nr:cupin domain-containing protein [Catalinimonas alkaloidigena]SDK64010.1 Uncharacterized protein YjlB [Catalinimonas alkaloidigena]
MAAFPVSSTHTIAHLFHDDGIFPNNEACPLLLYQGAFGASDQPMADDMEATFADHNWRNAWRNGIYSYHHYHSTSHEVLGIAQGSAQVRLGGDKHGKTFDVKAGDVIVIPAGVAHKNLSSSSDFLVIGAYPDGRTWDMNYGRAGERPRVEQNIAQVPLPDHDPVFGEKGPLLTHWQAS